MQNAHSNHPSLKMIAAYDRGDWPAILELVAPNARAYVGGMEADRDGWRAMGEMFARAFPDAKHDVISAHVSGEYATVVCNFRGTHKADFMGIPATNRSISFAVIHVDRVVEGRIVEHRGQFDSAGLMQQLTGPTPDPRAFFTELFAKVDAHDLSGAAAMMTPDVECLFAGQSLNIDGWRNISMMFATAFPVGKHALTEIITAGDRVTIIGKFEGTHRGEFQGIPATGREVSFGFIAVARVANGKLAQMQVQIDSAGLIQQLTAPAADPLALVKEIFRRIDSQDQDGALALATADFTFRFGDQAMNGAGWKAFSQQFFVGIPDGRHEWSELLAHGDRITGVGHFVGTHQGTLMGVPATGRKLSLGYVCVMRLRDGKLAEIQVQADTAGLMQQITG